MGDQWDSKDIPDVWNDKNESAAAKGRWLGVNNSMNKWTQEIERLEKKREQLHLYIAMKLDDKDYHGIADAAMDLRELDARSKAISEWLSDQK